MDPLLTPPLYPLSIVATINVHAGIALGSITEGAPLVCTRFEGADHNNRWSYKPFIPSPPTEHRLHGSNCGDIVNSISTETCLEYVADPKAFTWSYPIATTEAQRVAFEAADEHSHDHCTAFLSACSFGALNSQDVVEVLFIDLTPGQVAAMVMRGANYYGGQWTSKKPGKKIVLGEIEKLSIEKFDELVALVAPNLPTLQCVAVLRPEGAFPELLSIKVELKFINIPFKWVSLADLSCGSAMLLYHRLGLDYLEMPLFPGGYSLYPDVYYVTLADGRLINISPHNVDLGYRFWLFFTTSKDNQITATLRLFGRNTVYDDLTIKGLAPGPKGSTRIKVTTEYDQVNGGSVTTVQGLGSNLNVRLPLRGEPRNETEGSDDIFTRVQYVQFGIDGVIGELPE
jgi:hypothetical protein